MDIFQRYLIYKSDADARIKQVHNEKLKNTQMPNSTIYKESLLSYSVLSNTSLTTIELHHLRTVVSLSEVKSSKSVGLEEL